MLLQNELNIKASFNFIAFRFVHLINVCDHDAVVEIVLDKPIAHTSHFFRLRI